ncbi:MAG: hypothetical protein ACREF9_07370, partial [Opitutaceae bacterium]
MTMLHPPNRRWRSPFRWLCASLGALALITGASGAEKSAVRPCDLALAPGEPLNRRMLAQQQPVTTPTYDSDPVFVDRPGAGFVAWHSFAPGAERLVGRPLRGAADLPCVDLANGGGVHTPPELAAASNGVLALAWSTWRDGRWSVAGRQRSGGRWSAIVPLSSPNIEAVHPAIEPLDGGRFAVAWTQWNGEHFEIVWARWDANGTGTPILLSEPQTDAFRAQLVRGEGGRLDVVWDAYAANTSRIYARQLLPDLGAIETVSTSPDRCLKPAATRTSDGKLMVAWIRSTDVIAGAGTIDQMHAIELAERRTAGWHHYRNEQGGAEVAWLTLGLLAQIEPKPAATGGYMGRRRDPMFVRDGEATWLIWERKATQVGSTALITGELLARRLSGGEMGPTQLLAKGAVDYYLAHDAH